MGRAANNNDIPARRTLRCQYSIRCTVLTHQRRAKMFAKKERITYADATDEQVTPDGAAG